jgi:hypothetical protein
MANTRLDQIQSHLGSNGLEIDPTRVDDHVIIITGAAQGKIPRSIKIPLRELKNCRHWSISGHSARSERSKSRDQRS